MNILRWGRPRPARRQRPAALDHVDLDAISEAEYDTGRDLVRELAYFAASYLEAIRTDPTAFGATTEDQASAAELIDFLREVYATADPTMPAAEAVERLVAIHLVVGAG